MLSKPPSNGVNSFTHILPHCTVNDIHTIFGIDTPIVLCFEHVLLILTAQQDLVLKKMPVTSRCLV